MTERKHYSVKFENKVKRALSRTGPNFDPSTQAREPPGGENLKLFHWGRAMYCGTGPTSTLLSPDAVGAYIKNLKNP